MTIAGGGREGLRDRLEWLRILGVEELPIRSSSTAPAAEAATGGARGRPMGPAAQPVVQVGLFGGEEVLDDPAADAKGKRGRTREEREPHPLEAISSPEAPDPATALRLIREDLGDCRRCRLCEGRTQIVFGVGDPGARLMFVGEGPGFDEDRQGEPFVGRAGQLLNRIIESMGLRREEVYIATVVKCRPPENRTPHPDEIDTCSPFLFRQIAALAPRVIVCLGTPAAQTVLVTRATITHLRGTFREIRGIRVMPTFHPAYLLRNPAAKKEVWEDMKQVIAFLKESGDR
jgi:uracil-DNA glycosylase family 4